MSVTEALEAERELEINSVGQIERTLERHLLRRNRENYKLYPNLILTYYQTHHPIFRDAAHAYDLKPNTSSMRK